MIPSLKYPPASTGTVLIGKFYRVERGTDWMAVFRLADNGDGEPVAVIQGDQVVLAINALYRQHCLNRADAWLDGFVLGRMTR